MEEHKMSSSPLEPTVPAEPEASAASIVQARLSTGRVAAAGAETGPGKPGTAPEPGRGIPPAVFESIPLATVIPFPDRRPGAVRREDREAGMATAEYAIATLAAVAFAALLVAVLSSGDVRELLMSLIRAALSFG